jgi:hypothetical protein
MQKRKLTSYVIPVADFRGCTLEQMEGRLDPKLFPASSSDTVLTTPNSIFGFNIKKISLVNRLSSNGIPFEQFCDDVANGICTGCDEVYIVTKAFVDSERFEKTYLKPCIRGGQMNRYFTPKQTGEFVLYITDSFAPGKSPNVFEYLSKNKSLLIRKSVEKKNGTREWHVLFRGRDEALFKTPKIMIRQTADRIIATPDIEEGYYCINSVNVALLKKEYEQDLTFFIGLLNSSVLHFFYREISQEGGRVLPEVKPQRIRSLPIPKAEVAQKAIIERLAAYLLWLHREVLHNEELADNASATLLAGYFEQWVNALVYELFFPEPLHAAGLHFFRLAEEAKLPALSAIKDRELATLRAKFEELYATNHPLRQGLFALDSIEEIHIIQGKA